MKRQAEFHPLSEHHHHVLVLALEIRRAAESAAPDREQTLRKLAASVLRFWDESGNTHFIEEITRKTIAQRFLQILHLRTYCRVVCKHMHDFWGVDGRDGRDSKLSSYFADTTLVIQPNVQILLQSTIDPSMVGSAQQGVTCVTLAQPRYLVSSNG